MAPSKRPSEANDPSISPPPVKRKVHSSVTKSAVANFFTPASQRLKSALRVTWSERAPDGSSPATLLVARYEPGTPGDGRSGEEPPDKRCRIAAFDLDSTLVTTASGKTHAGDAQDWKWWDQSVPAKLREMHRSEGYLIVIVSNQAGLTLHASPKSTTGPKKHRSRILPFKQKVAAILEDLDLPVTLYAATAKDAFRKPRTGMWRELCGDFGLAEDEVDKEASIFVGDAGGRTALASSRGNGGVKAAAKKDFSCSDRNFAHNVGIKYATPDEFFLGEGAREFVREFDVANYPFQEREGVQGGGHPKTMPLFEKKNAQDVVLFVGPPGAGKSTFYWRHLEPLGYARINQDALKSRDKCLRAALVRLEEGEAVAIDNTNADPDTRAQWVGLARRQGVPIRCVWFRTPMAVAAHNDAVRAWASNGALNPEGRTALPTVAFSGFAARFREPRIDEGFEDVVEVEFAFRGSKEEHAVWARYWV